MPVMSYIAHSLPGKKTELLSALKGFPECEILPSTSHDVIIVVTETENKAQQERLVTRMHTLPGLHSLALVSGFDSP